LDYTKKIRGGDHQPEYKENKNNQSMSVG